MGTCFTLTEEEFNELKVKIDFIYQYVESLKKADNRLITTDELLQHIPVSRRALQNYRDRKIIRFTKKGRKVMYSLSEVLDDLKNTGRSQKSVKELAVQN